MKTSPTNPIMGTDPVDWVTVEPSNGAFRQLTSHSVLHKATCRHIKRAKPENVFPAFDGPQSEEWVWFNGTGFDRTCGTCVKAF